MRDFKWKLTGGITAVTAVGLILTGCSGSPSGPSSGGLSGAPSSANQTVTILGTVTGTEAQEYIDAWTPWATANNITIQYTGDRGFVDDLNTKVQANDVPNIALADPAQISTYAQSGKIYELDAAGTANVQNNIPPSMAKYVEVNGKVYGTVLDGALKGFVWYSPATFAKYNVQVPTTWDQLLTLTQTLQQQTGAPVWCAGFNSQGANGWPGADFTSEVVLGSAGIDTFNSWVAGTTPFTDPAIANAFTESGKILLNPQYVNAGYGDVASINATPFADVANKLADGSCLLTNQATFLEASFATATTAAGAQPTIGPDGDIWAFLMPGPTAGSNSVMGGLDTAAAFTNDPATMKVMAYLGSPEWATALAQVQNASYLPVAKGVDPSIMSDPLMQSALKIVQDPNTTFALSADDAMPNVVENAYWAGIVDWINGTPQDQVLSTIQASWADSGS